MTRYMVLLCLLGLCVASCASSPFAPSTPSTGCISGDCENGQGTQTLSQGRKYVGEFKDGKRNGQGTFTFPSGRKYAGAFIDGKPNGKGTETFPNGDKYVGEFNDGRRNGKGTFTFADGRKYVGQWESGLSFKKGTKSSAAALAFLIRKNSNSNEMKTWLSKAGVQPEIHNYTDSYYYLFKTKGIELCFNKSDKLTTVFLHSEGADKYHQFKGELPFGLSFALTRKKIESILGPPDKSGNKDVIRDWVIYSSLGISITYDRIKPDYLNARIKHISLWNNMH